MLKITFCIVFIKHFLPFQGLSADDKQPVWYILDEFGSRIHHADTPNCRLVPFFYASQNIAYDLLFPVSHLQYGGMELSTLTIIIINIYFIVVHSSYIIQVHSSTLHSITQ